MKLDAFVTDKKKFGQGRKWKDRITAKTKILTERYRAYILFVKPSITAMQRCVVMTHKNLLSFCFWRCRLTNEAVVTYCVITFAHHVTCSWNWRPGGVGQWLIIRTNSEKKDTNICSTPNKWKKGTSVECSRLNEKLKRITSLYVTHLKSSARSVHETVHPHISFQPSIMTRMRSPNANGNNKNTKEMKHCWEHAVSDRISEGKKKM